MRKTLILPFIALLLAACGSKQAVPAATPTNTSSSTPTRFPSITSLPPWPTETPTLIPTLTFTSTPVPTLISHEISQSEALVVLESYGGDTPCLPISTGLDLILFPDGELFVHRFSQEMQTYRIQTTRLSRQETCRLLNSIDQAGFFDYDPASYIFGESPGDGAPSVRISVQAWRSNSVDLYALREFLDHPDYFVPSSLPTILPALRKTYRLLADYHPVNMEIVTIDRVGVWIIARGETASGIPWPFPSINLAKATANWDQKGYGLILTLEGKDAEAIFDFFDQANPVCGEINVTEAGKSYVLAVRHLLPYEYPPTPRPAVTLSCSPTDGWIEVP